jgi:hypothetical protein
VISLVGLQMSSKPIDPRGQKGHLDFRGAGVFFRPAIFPNHRLFPLFGNSHRLPLRVLLRLAWRLSNKNAFLQLLLETSNLLYSTNNTMKEPVYQIHYAMQWGFAPIEKMIFPIFCESTSHQNEIDSLGQSCFAKH